MNKDNPLMLINDFDLESCLLSLSNKRPIFHSEADFQFALAWEIRSRYPDALIRLEYRPAVSSRISIDITIFYLGKTIPIELKYKTAKLKYTIRTEEFNLKYQSAQDIGKYDCLKNIKRIEDLKTQLENFSAGYTIWLTNDSSYWNPPVKTDTLYNEFSIHHLSQKHGKMSWASHAGSGTTKGRESSIDLTGNYEIYWKSYSNINVPQGIFKYALLKISDGINSMKI